MDVNMYVFMYFCTIYMNVDIYKYIVVRCMLIGFEYGAISKKKLCSF